MDNKDRNQERSAGTHVRQGLACLCAGLFLILLALVVTEHAAGIDDPVRYFFYSLRSEALTSVLIVLTNAANKYVIIGLCLLLLILPQTRLSFGVPLSAGALATMLLNSGIKHLVCRERPDVLHLVTETSWSFPSGHSISSLFFYGMALWLVWHHVQRLDHPVLPDGPISDPAPARLGSAHLPAYEKRTAWILTVLLLIPMVTVGLTRIYLGVHFPTDVLAAWCLAGCAIFVEAEIILALEHRDQNSTAPGSRSK